MAKKPLFSFKKKAQSQVTSEEWQSPQNQEMISEIDPGMVYDPPNPGRPGKHDWNEDPFMEYLKHDGAVDPTIADSRSEELLERKSTFWIPAGETEKIQALKEAQADQADAQNGQKTKILHSQIIWTRLIPIVSVVIGILLLLFLIFQMVFRIHPDKIFVEGNDIVSSQEIIRLSGITGEDNIWLLDDKPIQERIESNIMLMFVCVDKHLPDSITIRVKERVPAAYISYCGVLYTIDSRGMVLRSSDNTSDPPDLLKVEGFDIKSCNTGRRLSVKNNDQIDIFMELVREIKAIGLTELISQLYVEDSDNINLMTSEGSYIRMGTSGSIHAKLEALKIVYEYVTEHSYGPGTIDVSNPERPSFIPEQAQS